MRRIVIPQSEHVIQYRILDPKRGNPMRTIAVQASANEIKQLVREGFLIKRRLISASDVGRLRYALSEILNAKESQGRDPADECFGSPYLRHLVDKHSAFFSLFRLKTTLSIAQAVLGPQVKFEEITARVTDFAVQSPATPWHIHLRVVPDPLPPFFAYPHAIECLLYLDDIDEESGPLCVLPGSHRRMSEIYPVDDVADKPGQEVLSLEAGDCLVMHPNLWHRALPSVRNSGLRRLIIFGYFPSWVGGEERGSPRPEKDVLAEMRGHRNTLTRELAGEFFWG